MTDTRLIPISAEDVERLRSLRTFCAETQRDVPIISDLVTRYESASDEPVVYRYRATVGDATGPLRATREEAVEDGRYGVRGRYEVEAVAVLTAFTQEQDR